MKGVSLFHSEAQISSAQTLDSGIHHSITDGSIKISYGRFDLHLMRDENSKDYISIIGIDGFVSLEQSSTISFGSNIINQELILDFGLHEAEEDAISYKQSADGGFYIAHMQNDDQLVNVVMQVPGMYLRLRTLTIESKVDTYFVTFFDRDIELPVKLGYYRWIGDLIGLYFALSKAVSSTNDESKKVEESKNFDIREYVFKPNINSIGQLIPVDKALGYFGFKTQEFPSALYTNLTRSLSSAIDFLGKLMKEDEYNAS
jgi:hypothetical protein